MSALGWWSPPTRPTPLRTRCALSSPVGMLYLPPPREWWTDSPTRRSPQRWPKRWNGRSPRGRLRGRSPLLQSLAPTMPELADKRVLVTGGGGFVGAPTVRALLAEGAVVRVLDTVESSRLDGVDCEVVVGDISDPA